MAALLDEYMLYNESYFQVISNKIAYLNKIRPKVLQAV